MKNKLLSLLLLISFPVILMANEDSLQVFAPPAGPSFTTKAKEYVACPGDNVYIETTLTSPYTYKVYTTATGNVLSNPTNPNYFVKTNTGTEVAYIQAFNGATAVGSRLPVNVRYSHFCGATTDQNGEGVVLYFDDFGGNSPSDPIYSSTPLPMDAEIALTFHAGTDVGSGQYGLIKHLNQAWSINNNCDHTYQGDMTRGYMMMIDPVKGMNNAAMYVGTITNLCAGAELAFSFWACDLQCCVGARPMFDIQLINPSTNEVLVQSCVWTPDRSGNINNQTWNQYGITYTVPVGLNSVKFKLSNRNDEYSGNDYVIDDIKVMFYGGKLTQSNTEIASCYNGTVSMQTVVTLDHTMFQSPAYKWQFTTTPSNASSWQDISGSNVTTYTINNAKPTASGYYRMILANSNVIAGAPANGSCLLMTEKNFHVTVYGDFTPGTIASTGQTICAGDNVNTVGSVSNASGGSNPLSYQWYVNGTAISGATSATYTPTAYKFTPGTYVFTRRAKPATCSDWKQSSGSWTLVVRHKPAPVISGESTACFGADLSLSTQGGYAQYTWTLGGGGTVTSGAGTNAIHANWSSGGSKTVSVNVKHADGCSTTATKTVNVLGDLQPGAILYGKHVCNTKDTVIVITNTTPASGGSNGRYEWQQSNTNVASSFVSIPSSNVEFYTVPASYHKYYRRAYITNCGTVYTNVVYIVNSGNVDVGSIVGNDAAYCSGTSVSHTMNVGNITVESGAPYVVQWQSSMNNGASWTNIGSPIPSSTANKSFTYTNSNFTQPIQFRYQVTIDGCTPFYGNGVVRLSVNPLPQVNASVLTQVKCLGEAIDNVVISSNNANVTLSPLPAGLSYTSSTISGKPAAAGNYTITVTAASNQTPVCNAKVIHVSIVVNDTLVPSLSASSNVCLKSSEVNNTLTIKENNGNMTHYTYEWDLDGGTVVAGANSNQVGVQWGTQGNKNIRLTITHKTTQCVSHAGKAVTVNPVPEVAILPVLGTLCPSIGTKDLSAWVTLETTPDYTYTWGGDLAVSPSSTVGAATTTGTTVTIPKVCDQTYSVTLSIADANGCKSSSNPITLRVNDIENPVIDAALVSSALQGDRAQNASGDCIYVVPELTTMVRNASSDNCTSRAELAITQSIPAGTPVAANTDVVVTVKDFCDNPATVTVPVTVPDPIVVTTPSGTWTYDRNEHSVPTFSLGNGSVNVSDAASATPITLDNGDVVTVKVETTIFNAGTATNTAVVTVKDAEGHDVTCYYDIRKTEGILTINKKTLRIYQDTSKVYDGTPFEVSYSQLHYDGLVNGDVMTSGRMVTDDYWVGTYTCTDGFFADMYAAFKAIQSGFGPYSVTRNYEVTFDVKLTITKRPVEFTANSDSKVFDNSPIANSGYSVTGGTSLASTDAASVTVEGGQLCVGSSENTVTAAQIMHTTEPRDVTECYTITTKKGTLTVLPITEGFVCPDAVTVVLREGTYDTTLTTSVTQEATLVPAVAGTSVGHNLSELNPMKVGDHTVVWTLYDVCGNAMVSCEQLVKVVYASCAGISYQGYDYGAVRIGYQCWLTENLRNTKDAGGHDIANYHAYKDDMDNMEKFGYLYSWYATVGVEEGNNGASPSMFDGADGKPYVQGICPAGWGVPSQSDFDILNTTAGNVAYLKDMDPQYWLVGKGGLEPNLGFHSRGSGLFNSALNRYEDLLSNAYYWSSDYEPGSPTVVSLEINYYCSSIMETSSAKTDLQSVRCIKKL